MNAAFPGRFCLMSDGGWVMQLWGVRPEGRFRGIVRFDDDGTRLWELENTPELLSMDPVSGHLLLWDPEGLDPSKVFRARETR